MILPQAGFETPALIAQQPLETHEPGVLSRSHRHDALHPAQNDVAAFQTMGSKCPVREGSEGDLRPPVLRRDALLAPDQLISQVADELLKDLDRNREEYRKNPRKTRELVDRYLLPHFDTQYAAQLVLARHWRDATPEQRKRFIDAFYNSLLQNYGEALLEFTPDRLRILPYRGDPQADRATVRTEIRRNDGSRVPVNYSLRRTADGWKAYDVTIEGISYLKSYRTDFNSEIQQRGLDAVIQRLESQVAAGKAPDPTGGAGQASDGNS